MTSAGGVLNQATPSIHSSGLNHLPDRLPMESVDTDLTRYGYAPGDYYNRCCTCTKFFIGAKRSSRCESCASYAKYMEPPTDKPQVSPPPAIFSPTHRHLKTGGLYKVLYSGLIEKDLTTVIIYQDENGVVWVRPFKEFIEKFESLR